MVGVFTSSGKHPVILSALKRLLKVQQLRAAGAVLSVFTQRLLMKFDDDWISPLLQWNVLFCQTVDNVRQWLLVVKTHIRSFIFNSA